MNNRGTAYDTKPQFKYVANNGANYTVERCGANWPENPPSIRKNEITDQGRIQYFRTAFRIRRNALFSWSFARNQLRFPHQARRQSPEFRKSRSDPGCPRWPGAIEMDLNSMMGKAKDFAGSANEGVSKMLDEFNAALPTMRALGFTVQDIQVGMGLLPEVKAKLAASADNIDVKAIDEIIQKKSEQKTLVTVLKALQTAYNVRDRLGDLGLKGVEINATLGLPPNISIGFIKSSAATAQA
jgi:hypothetical protein